jgi:hypothetical protein
MDPTIIIPFVEKGLDLARQILGFLSNNANPKLDQILQNEATIVSLVSDVLEETRAAKDEMQAGFARIEAEIANVVTEIQAIPIAIQTNTADQILSTAEQSRSNPINRMLTSWRLGRALFSKWMSILPMIQEKHSLCTYPDSTVCFPLNIGCAEPPNFRV